MGFIPGNLVKFRQLVFQVLESVRTVEVVQDGFFENDVFRAKPTF